LKTEAYGYAVRDATRAIELKPGFVKVRNSPLPASLPSWTSDPWNIGPRTSADRRTSTQAYYRRATAYTAILKPKEAVKDFKTCVKIDPGNKDAKLKLVECEKTVRQLAFFAAIEVGDEPSAAEGLDVDNIHVEDSYDGVRLGKEMTQEFIDDMIERFKNGKHIHKKYAYQIVIAVKNIVYKEPTMVETEVPEGVELTVCGDTHGLFCLPRPSTDRRNTGLTIHVNRSIFRSHGVVPVKRHTKREALVSVQRRLCRQRFLVVRDCLPSLRIQMAPSQQLLYQPW